MLEHVHFTLCYTDTINTWEAALRCPSDTVSVYIDEQTTMQELIAHSSHPKSLAILEMMMLLSQDEWLFEEEQLHIYEELLARHRNTINIPQTARTIETIASTTCYDDEQTKKHLPLLHRLLLTIPHKAQTYALMTVLSREHLRHTVLQSLPSFAEARSLGVAYGRHVLFSHFAYIVSHFGWLPYATEDIASQFKRYYTRIEWAIQGWPYNEEDNLQRQQESGVLTSQEATYIRSFGENMLKAFEQAYQIQEDTLIKNMQQHRMFCSSAKECIAFIGQKRLFTDIFGADPMLKNL